MCWRKAGWSGAAARPTSRQATTSNSVISGYKPSHEMISAEQNELMTRIGPGTPAGKLLRNYWQPVALVDEMQGPRPVKALKLLGESLVLFRTRKIATASSSASARTAVPTSPTAGWKTAGCAAPSTA